MRLNGLLVVAARAIDQLEHPLITRYRKAIVLGSLREDVWYIPGLRIVYEHLSFSHFYEPPIPGGIVPLVYPGPRMKGELFFERAVRAFLEGRRAEGFVQLGRVVHLLTDMACPVHAHRTPHWTDPFEWHCEAQKDRLMRLPVPYVHDASTASALIESMARLTQPYATDSTHHHLGALAQRLGLIQGVSSRQARDQATALIPLCAGHAAALLRLYLRRVGEA